MFDELADNDRMFLRHVGCQLQEAFEFFLVGADIHGGATQHITRTNQDRKTHLSHKLVDIFHRRKLFPTRLVYTDAVQHGGKFLAIFGIVDTLGGCPQDIDMLLVQTHRQVIGYLAACRDNHAMRIFQFEDIHHTLEGQFIEVKAVTHIIVGRNCFRIVVDHHRTPTFLTDRFQRLHATPVELDRTADPVSAGTQHDDGTVVTLILHVVFRTAIGQIQIVRLRRVFSSQRIDLFHYRNDAVFLTKLADLHHTFFYISLKAEGASYLKIGETLPFRLAKQ